MSKEHRAKQTRETSHLHDRIHQINRAYSTLSWKEIRSSEGVRSEAENLLYDLGPTLWPDFDATKGPLPTWVFQYDGGHEEAFKKRKEAPMQRVRYHS